jgi:hypothetical protein
MRIRVMVKGTDGKGGIVLKDVFEFPVVYTKSNKFDETTQWALTSALEYLRKDEAHIIVIEKVIT